MAELKVIQSKIEEANENIDKINTAIDNCDSEYELAQLAIELDFWENELLVADEVMQKGISRAKDILLEQKKGRP